MTESTLKLPGKCKHMQVSKDANAVGRARITSVTNRTIRPKSARAQHCLLAESHVRTYYDGDIDNSYFHKQDAKMVMQGCRRKGLVNGERP